MVGSRLLCNKTPDSLLHQALRINRLPAPGQPSALTTQIVFERSCLIHLLRKERVKNDVIFQLFFDLFYFIDLMTTKKRVMLKASRVRFCLLLNCQRNEVKQEQNSHNPQNWADLVELALHTLDQNVENEAGSDTV